mmetsp:Transcript_61722/g.177705  ORF Transcript_61722/g.177705 Transcript_61722/m.177705 type:complete len:103 (+) Transcript_61722:668-976(+)
MSVTKSQSPASVNAQQPPGGGGWRWEHALSEAKQLNGSMSASKTHTTPLNVQHGGVASAARGTEKSSAPAAAALDRPIAAGGRRDCETGGRGAVDPLRLQFA